MPIERTCKTCGVAFSVPPSTVKRGGGIYCSRACHFADPDTSAQRRRSTKAAWEDDETRARLMEGIAARSESEEWRAAEHFQRGEAHPRYKGEKRKRARAMGRYEYKAWRTAVFQRDGFACRRCDERGGRLVAHHVKPWAEAPALRYDVGNGETLCEACHDAAHGLKRRPRTYKCVDCGAPKRWRQSGPRCRRCAALNGWTDERRTQPKPCAQCGTDFVPGRTEQKYCSPACGFASRRKRVTVECAVCGASVERRPCEVNESGNNYCGHKCRGRALSEQMQGNAKARQ